ncbi:protein javelin [Anastrepha ludens]|uniref:protein javelin n=1 Tax=Anastrepha ludens TaxID=28586 RepID=UPI0023AF0C24|nr:protein javelin [Anastrepha ludens]
MSHTQTLRRTKELTYNYVDRVRLAEHSLQQDYKCPTRGSGWRHNNKSISHLDLATSCHSTAFGPSHWPHNRQLRHSRSLDYAHLTDRCKDHLDIAEFYWRLDPEGDALYEDEYEDEVPDEEETLIGRYNGEQRQEPPYRDYNYADNSQLLHPPHLHHNSSGGGGNGGVGSSAAKTVTAATTAAATAATLQAFDFGSESCSLRRSRSLAVIREETFSDLQITTANNSRRSQLIPRARIVNRGFIRERERLICGGSIGANKHHHHHHHHAGGGGSCNNAADTCEDIGLSAAEQKKVQHNNSINAASGDIGELYQQPQHIHAHPHPHSHLYRHHQYNHTSGGSNSSANNSNHDNLQSQHSHKNNQPPQTHQYPQSPTVAQPPHHNPIQHHNQPHQSREADDYYDNLKRLDALTLGLVEQLHPWHNEKSDLESLNSDYFKNSLHQSHELQQQLDFEALEEAVSYLASEKPRIYQSHRQQRTLSSSQQKLHNATDSYQENSQSSAFPETTTSNSDDQTDSASLSEQEYDLKKIEKIYKETTKLDAAEEGYELISLTTTTRTRIETTEDEGEEELHSIISYTDKDVDNFGCLAAAEATADVNDHGSGVLKRSRALSENLEKLIAYDSLYLSSEEGSESTLIDENQCGAYERTTHVTTAKLAEESGETATLLHFTIEDIIYEPNTNPQYSGECKEAGKGADNEIATVTCAATILAETEAEEIATQTTKEKQLVSVVERVNTKIEKIPLTATVSDEEELSKTLESTTLYTQILKVGHAPATCTETATTITYTTTSTSTTATPNSVASARALVAANAATALPTGVVAKPATVSTLSATQSTVGITSSVASKPKILSVVEKRKWKRHNDTASHTANASSCNETSVQPRSCGLESIATSGSPPIDYPLAPLKRQSTANSLTYLPFQTNLSDNQYHSLPDLNIGQSLKVSECIDAKLRSSYNVNNTELDDCYLRESTATNTNTTDTSNSTAINKAKHLLENTNTEKLKQQLEEVVTSEEIYDSIKRFGRAHQKARKKEYQELHEAHLEKAKKREVKEKCVRAHNIANEGVDVQNQREATTTTYPDSLVEEITGKTVDDGAVATEIDPQENTVSKENYCTDSHIADDTESNVTANSSLDTSTSEYQEQPKDAPDIEVENFSKLIERRAKEIKEKTGKRTLGAEEAKYLKNSTEIQNSVTISNELCTQQADGNRVNPSAGSKFRIIVTDAHNNIIEEDAIDNDDNLKDANKAETHSRPQLQKLNILADVTIRRQEKREISTKDKSTIVSTHTRVASLKRVPSKPKRQQHPTAHHHCCQQQCKNNSNKAKDTNGNSKNIQSSSNKTNAHVNDNKTNFDNSSSNNNYCELSIKSKERRVLSTQIYKARPVKVLTANDSFRRRSTEGAVTAAGSKMSRPQILHVVDNKRRGDMLGAGKNASNSKSSNKGVGINFNKAKRVEDSQVENEYLKKVDAVRNYWSKLAKDEDEQKQEAVADDKQIEVEQEQTLKYTNKQENIYELPKGSQEEQESQKQQARQPQKPQPEPRHFILGAQSHEQTQSQTDKNVVNPPTTKLLNPNSSFSQDEFCSFMPSIEIVELDGDKKATIVSAVPPNSDDPASLANDANGEPQFDHIRYKVLKSQQLLRNNMMPRSKKEAQFDGLIQYLQEYSFQELLANNNVVIVEPVRTKIERPLTTIAHAAANVTATALQKLGQKTIESSDNGKATIQYVNIDSASKVEPQAKLHMSAGAQSNDEGTKPQQRVGKASDSVAKTASGGGSGGIKRHFFYQPVRVNRELYEEELPNPDIVRNVRKFFEENVLPTPRGGMQLQHTSQDEDTFVERSAATQLPSPRARRARKYRYLTIDTSYGHMPHQHQQHQQQQLTQQQLPGQHPTKGASPTARKWDTASLSSGISSGDLSSPCECNETDITTTSEKQEAINEEALKGVHVQTVVQGHNNRNMRNKTSAHIDGTIGGENDYNGHLPCPRPRPRSSAIRGGEEPTYRITDIYEQHASQQQNRNFTREDKFSRLGDDGPATDEEENEDADDEDLDEEVYESHYVSKDVLEKIRECGSTVTYYGGRVLQSTSPDPLHYGSGYNGATSNNGNIQVNAASTNTMTLTRRRVRQIESCNACEPPQDCAHQQPTTHKFPQQHDKHNDKKKGNSAEVTDDNRESSLGHFGIKFKLVKSNSCSSRLELAGTGAEIVETGADETEVVKKMVHHFECTKLRQVEGKDEPLTINNQTPARKLVDCGQVLVGGVSEVKQVTVNNHINVPMTTYSYTLDDVKPTNLISNGCDRTNYENNKSEMSNEITYQSSAMDIRLSHVDQRKSQECAADNASGDGNATLKVWRNKNVDLAYTMTKKQNQQQQQQGRDFHAESDGKAKATISPKQNGNQSETLFPSTTTPASANVAGIKRILESNLPLKSRNDDYVGGALDTANNESCDVLDKINLRNVEQLLFTENCQTPSEALRTAGTQVKAQVTTVTATTTPILAPRSTQLPAQIVVPVEIHRADQQTPEPHGRTSVASSRGSSITTVITTNSTALRDNNVVRHYVANDKSLFQKRKYDDIEFEEFEVYDPTKDFEKLIENEKRREEAKKEGKQQPVSGELAAIATRNGISNLDARYEEDEDEEEDGRKSKLGSDCYDYDSLEDKL